ncbi:predicted protein [Nematostella vectensis]|uniref:CCHC-type domain-containing protein n=1 Tax=Nematostella vectensis TaxID=45351 RepID=A7RP21_NEMVE|nr:zinc finger CCHC domain-containing protein 8 [Nematostella vectensis]EDO46780.1 predicted protein [Nematostella vectensis]|eukprot:XP_001638843.1 predicted protein [Nematostella vectensis]
MQVYLPNPNMADGFGKSVDSFDESFLFSEFEDSGKPKSSCLSFPEAFVKEESSQHQSMEDLKLENYRLKMALGKFIFPGKDSKVLPQNPIAQATFFSNQQSLSSRSRIEAFLATLGVALQGENSKSSEEDDEFIYPHVQPSLEEFSEVLDGFIDNTNKNCDSVVSCVRYFDIYCVDCCGLPLHEFNPRDSSGWDIPLYEQVYFVALPFIEDSSSKVRVSRKKTCFNCGAVGHALSNCPEPHNQAQIESQRRKFLNKFTSPIVKGSRYHINEKRFGEFKPGVISPNLREALGIEENEVPPFVYKMRCLGYPPGYLPSSKKPSLLLYDATGNVDDYIMDDDDDECLDNDKSSEEKSNDKKSLFVKYPGFNCPLPEGGIDCGTKMGFPAMQRRHQIQEMEWWYKQGSAQKISQSREIRRRDRKRRLSDTEAGVSDMDLDDEVSGPIHFDLGTPTDSPHSKDRKRGRYDNNQSADEGGGYSPCHPGLQIGEEEEKLIKRLHQKHHLPAVTPSPSPNTELKEKGGPSKRRVKRKRISTCSKEEGELSEEDGEEKYQDYVTVDEWVASEEEEVQSEGEGVQTEEGGGKEGELKGYRDWWVEEPLAPSSKGHGKTHCSPPPLPAVKLPMDLLTRFYTSSTVLQKVSFEDRVMWLDPVYGNIQVSSGRYDKLKEILQKVKKRRR